MCGSFNHLPVNHPLAICPAWCPPGNLGSLMGDAVVMAYFHPKQASAAGCRGAEKMISSGAVGQHFCTPVFLDAITFHLICVLYNSMYIYIYYIHTIYSSIFPTLLEDIQWYNDPLRDFRPGPVPHLRDRRRWRCRCIPRSPSSTSLGRRTSQLDPRRRWTSPSPSASVARSVAVTLW